MNTDMLRSHGYDPRGPGADRRYGSGITVDNGRSDLETSRKPDDRSTTSSNDQTAPCAYRGPGELGQA